MDSKEDEDEEERSSQQSFGRFMVEFVENRPMKVTKTLLMNVTKTDHRLGDTILSLAVWVYDVRNKVGICGRNSCLVFLGKPLKHIV